MLVLVLAGCASSSPDPIVSAPASPDPPSSPPAATQPAPPSPFDEPPSHPTCSPAYRVLPGRLGLNLPPRSEAPFGAEHALASPPPAQPSFDELRREVLAATGVLLLTGEATWTAGPPRDRGGSALRELVAHDPLLGHWPAAELSPRGEGPHPAILLLHGHGDTVEDALSLRFGDALASRGFVVLAPSLRAYWDGGCEDEASRALLAAGLSLMGVHLAEASRALVRLRGDPGVDPARIYVIGHSGGGGVARLLPFVDPVAGVITDGPQAFGQLPDDRRIGDDYLPALRELGEALGRHDALGVPSAFHPIGPEGDPAEVARRLRAWEVGAPR